MLRLSPSSSLYGLSDILTVYLNGRINYTQAILYLDKALAVDPMFEDALFDKGDALNYLGNYSGAITYLDKALAIDPNDKYALNDKGWALNALGNYSGAIKYLDKALAIDAKLEIGQGLPSCSHLKSAVLTPCDCVSSFLNNRFLYSSDRHSSD